MYDSNDTKLKMATVIDRFIGELSKVRTGRAHTDMLNGIKAETYGQCVPLNQIANITVSGGTMLVVQPFDPNNIKAISDAIRADQSLGFNPTDDGRIVRIPVPPLTEERRLEIIKNVKGKVEEAKIAIRQARDDARKELKEIELSQDETRAHEKTIDQLTQEFNARIDELFKAKEKELLTI